MIVISFQNVPKQKTKKVINSSNLDIFQKPHPFQLPSIATFSETSVAVRFTQLRVAPGKYNHLNQTSISWGFHLRFGEGVYIKRLRKVAISLAWISGKHVASFHIIAVWCLAEKKSSKNTDDFVATDGSISPRASLKSWGRTSTPLISGRMDHVSKDEHQQCWSLHFAKKSSYGQP